MINGIDVSMWQANIDFSKVKAAGYEIVYIKATEGFNIKDKKFEQNYKNAKANGLKVGVYHFFNPRQNAISQADAFYNAIKDKDIDCKLAIDVETSKGTDKDTLARMVCNFADAIIANTGLEVVIYTYTSFANSSLGKAVSKYPAWIAEYGSKAPKSNSIWGNNYIAWQYSSTGKVSGSGSVDTDLDYFTNDIYLSSKKPSGTDTPPIVVSTLNTTAAPIEIVQIKVGDLVKIVGLKYVTGQTIPDWVKQNNHTVSEITGNKALSKEIQSWIYLKDLRRISSGSGDSTNTSSNVYTVKVGDTLGEIAIKYKITIDKLMKLNGLKNANLIYVGQKLKLS